MYTTLSDLAQSWGTTRETLTRLADGQFVTEGTLSPVEVNALRGLWDACESAFAEAHPYI